MVVQVLDLNPSIAGIAGDMTIAALLGLKGSDFLSVINGILNELHPGLGITLEHVKQDLHHGLRIHVTNGSDPITATEIEAVLTNLANKHLSSPYSEITLNTITDLIEAEKAVHSTQEVHFHELGTWDTVVDIFTPSLLLQELGISKGNYHPVAIGRGTVKTSHGILPVPTPASRFLLEKYRVETVPGPVGEASTPTGIALYISISKNLPQVESVYWTESALGFGTKEWEDRLNFLQLAIGTTAKSSTTVSVLETNIDDISGEFLGSAFDILMNAGALDVSYYPIYMKKNRPGYTLRVVCKDSHVSQLSELIMRTTGSLGVRVLSVNRHIGRRASESISLEIPELGGSTEIRIKVGSRRKVEFDDLSRLAVEHNMTPLEVLKILNKYLVEQYGS